MGLSLVLCATGLVYLQISDAEADLVSCLPGYGLIAVAALVAAATIRSTSRPDHICIGATALFFGYLIVRAVASPMPYAARADLYCALTALTLYVLVVVAFPSRARAALIVVLLAFGVVHVLVAVIQTGFGENLTIVSSLDNVEGNSRATGLFVNPDHLAGLLEILVILGLSLTCWSRLPKWGKVCVAYLTAVGYFGIVLTGSRGGYLSAIVSLTIFAALSLITLRSGGKTLLLRFGGSGLLLLAAVIFVLGLFVSQTAPLKERLQHLVVDEGRLDLWQAAVKQWELQPVFGTGSGTYRFYGRQFRTERVQMDPVYAHNDYLQLLGEYGVIGGAGFVLFLIAHLVRGMKTFLHLGPKRIAAGGWPLSDRLALNIGAISAIGGYAVHSAVDFNLHIPANALVLTIVFGVIAHPDVERGSANFDVTARTYMTPITALLGIFLLIQCIRLLPGEYYTESARTALRDEDPEAAVRFANQAIASDAQNPNTFFYFGRALSAVADRTYHPDERVAYYNKALDAFDHARLLAPLDGTYASDMAFALDQLERFSEAEWLYEIARERDPRSISLAQLYQTHLELWTSQKEATPKQN